MNTIEYENFHYQILDEAPSAGDFMLVNNPHPDSSLKNVIRVCSSVENDNTVIPEDQNLVLRKYPIIWCKKAIQLKEPSTPQLSEEITAALTNDPKSAEPIIEQLKFDANKFSKADELAWYKLAVQSMLKPCPFCQSLDIKLTPKNKEGKEEVKCLTCGCTLIRAQGCNVVNAWNNRKGQ